MKFQERYQFDFNKDLLGKGGFASVYKANDVLLDRQVAVKIFSSQNEDKYSVVEEIKKVIKFEHPSLLRYFDVILLDQENALGQREQLQIGIMEYANAGDLKQFAIKNPKSPLLFKFLQQVLQGLEYLHQKNIVHRDLKPQNILLVEDNGQINAKISDFGISKDVNSDTKSSTMVVGTIEYMAPEQFSPQKYGIEGKVSSNVDIWSFGIMVHELITQNTPFGSRDGNTTAEMIMSSILSTEQPEDINTLPEPYKTLVKKCLVANANLRIKKASDLLKYFEVDTNQSKENINLKQEYSNLTKSSSDDKTKAYPKNPLCDETKVYSFPSISEEDVTKAYKINTAVAKKNTNQIYKKIGLGVVVLTFIFSAYFSYSYFTNSLIQNNLEKGLIALKKSQYSSAVELFSEGAEKGHPESLFQLGNLYRKGLGVPKNDLKAFQLYILAANKNFADAQNILGYIYETGLGVEPDINKAIAWYEKGAAQENSFAQTNLGIIYRANHGEFSNPKKASFWLKKAAKNNNPHAIYQLGEMYEHGEEGGGVNLSKAKDCYIKAAKLGNQDARLALVKIGSINYQ